MLANPPISPITAQAAALIETRTGLSVRARLHTDLAVILDDLARSLSYRTPIELLRVLRESDDASPAWQALIGALTINETYFFRDKGAFDLLSGHILPEIIAQRRRSGQFYLNLWSAGCASGEEAYSLAVMLLELVPDLPNWNTRLVGTDINTQALHNARRAQYREWSFRQLDPRLRARYFTQTGDGQYTLDPSAREIVTFKQANLLDGPPITPLDVIFCRNVLLYFGKEHIHRAEALLYEALTPGGWLVLGQAEAARFERDRWLTRVFSGVVLYQKPPQSKSAQWKPSNAGSIQWMETEKSAAPNPNTTPIASADYENAARALREERFDDAEREVAALLLQGSDDALLIARLRVLLARNLANRRALPEAHAQLDAAQQSVPLLADVYYLRAILFQEEGRAVDADKALRAALYAQRDHPLAAFMQGNLYAQSGDHTRAVRAWKRARRGVADLAPQALISDLSDLTAADLDALLCQQLGRLS
ncbi:MAG: hypothetical protein H7175_27055 [Burkholderiales bacterium]|nr:hypothetical protein [Anaerolineae bacterium]